MSKITTTEEADAFVKQNVQKSLDLIPVVRGEPQVVEGTDIRYWHISLQNPDRPDDRPRISLIGGPRQVVLDSGQVISIPVRPPGPDSKSFKELVLEQYLSDS